MDPFIKVVVFTHEDSKNLGIINKIIATESNGGRKVCFGSSAVGKTLTSGGKKTGPASSLGTWYVVSRYCIGRPWAK